MIKCSFKGDILQQQQPLVEAPKVKCRSDGSRSGYALSEPGALAVMSERDNGLSLCNCSAQRYVTGVVLLQIQEKAAGLKSQWRWIILVYFIKLICIPPSFCLSFFLRKKRETCHVTSLDPFLASGRGFALDIAFLTHSCYCLSDFFLYVGMNATSLLLSRIKQTEVLFTATKT